MRGKTTVLVVLLILFTWAGAGGISYGIVELAGGGPQGEQGPPGPQGPSGAPGQSPVLGASDLCGALIGDFLEALSTPGLSDTQLRSLGAAARACLEAR